MATLLAKIRIHRGKASDFEDLMAYMYRESHGTEKDLLRYEYWRGREPGMYYCLLSFADAEAFWRHQASPHHEGEMQRFQACIAELDLEVIDPVAEASPLPATRRGDARQVSDPEVRRQAELFPVQLQDWWLPHRGEN